MRRARGGTTLMTSAGKSCEMREECARNVQNQARVKNTGSDREGEFCGLGAAGPVLDLVRHA